MLSTGLLVKLVQRASIHHALSLKHKEVEVMQRYRLAVLVLLVALLPALAACELFESERDFIEGTWTAQDGVGVEFVLTLRGEESLTGSLDITTANGTGVAPIDVTGTYTHPSVTLRFNPPGGEGDPTTGTVNDARDRLTLNNFNDRVMTFARQ